MPENRKDPSARLIALPISEQADRQALRQQIKAREAVTQINFL